MRWATGSLATVVLAGSLGVASAGEPGHEPNPKLTAIAENSWEKVAGFAPAPRGILAYSGGVYDSVNHRFLIFGGGHADYWGNEVCAFSPATLTWQKMYEPDARARYTNDNLDHKNGKLKDSDKPYTRHSYNQLCFLKSSGAMFIFGGCGPGWGDIKPTCMVPSDAWSYSFKDNKWTQLSDNARGFGYAKACCYDSKRDTVWAYGKERTELQQFDLKAKTWKRHPVKSKIVPVGINVQMEYLPKSDRVMIVGSTPADAACTVNLEDMSVEAHPLEGASGGAGLTYLPEHDAALYLHVPRGDPPSPSRLALFDCATGKWRDVDSQVPELKGTVWSRFRYDPVDKVALLVSGSGVWAYQPPKEFSFKGDAGGKPAAETN